MSRRRSIVVAIVAMAVIALAGAALARAGRPSALPSDGRGADAMPTAATPPLAVFRRPARSALPPALHGIPVAEARAYAAAGAHEDGRGALTDLDAETAAALAQARENLAAQEPSRGAGRPHVLPGGTVVAIAPRRRAGADRAEPATAGTAPGETSAVARELATLAVTGDVSLREGTHVISGRGAWAGISHRPDDGALRIVDAGEGGHAFTVRSADFGTVRVNGGIVVPGRHYRIDGPITITAGVEVGVDIVPLDAVPEYWDQPFALPTGPG